MANRKSPKPIFLVNEQARQAAIAAIRELPVDGTMKITIAGAKDKSAHHLVGPVWIHPPGRKKRGGAAGV